MLGEETGTSNQFLQFLQVPETSEDALINHCDLRLFYVSADRQKKPTSDLCDARMNIAWNNDIRIFTHGRGAFGIHSDVWTEFLNACDGFCSSLQGCVSVLLKIIWKEHPMQRSCKYFSCSWALTFEQSRADGNTRIATWEFAAYLLGIVTTFDTKYVLAFWELVCVSSTWVAAPVDYKTIHYSCENSIFWIDFKLCVSIFLRLQDVFKCILPALGEYLRLMWSFKGAAAQKKIKIIQI